MNGKWVFGMVERGSNKCFMQVVANRSRNTLLPIIRQRILPCTTIMSDCWRAYSCLGTQGYGHMTVNHSVNFVDPVTAAHTNSIEGTWSATKRSLSTNHVQGQFDTYLAEYVWRRKYRDKSVTELFRAFLRHATQLHPPATSDGDPG